MQFFLKILILITLLSLTVACVPKKEPKEEISPFKGALSVSFDFKYDTLPFALNTAYLISSGEEIKVSEIQYFISNMVLHKDDGTTEKVSSDDYVHYIDIATPTSLMWKLNQPVKQGVYTALSFTFGFEPSYNVSNRFANPPESLMFWPEVLGGGYHYMKLNGKWKIPGASTDTNFGVHMGIGQTWSNGQTVAFHHNQFTAKDTVFFFIAQGGSTQLNITMDVKQWFENPVVWNFSQFGGAIMQNQTAMETLKGNGWNVFSVKKVK